MPLTPFYTSSIATDTDGNIGVFAAEQVGVAKRIPLYLSSVNVDEEGKIGVFGIGSEAGNGNGNDFIPMTESEIEILVDNVF